MTEGKKYDKGKLEWSLLPMDTLEEVVKVLMYGADKYSRGNWMLVEPERYYNAAMRHLQDHWVHKKEIDEESGYSHLAHAICCLIFMEWFRQNEASNRDYAKKFFKYDDEAWDTYRISDLIGESPITCLAEGEEFITPVAEEELEFKVTVDREKIAKGLQPVITITYKEND